MLKDSLDSVQKAIQDTARGSTLEAFSNNNFSEEGKVTNTARFSNALSQGSGAFKSSFQAVSNYMDVVFESDPVATASPVPSPPPLFPPGRSGGSGGRAPAPVGVTSGLFTLVTGNPNDSVRYNAGASTTYDVAVDDSGVYVSTGEGVRRYLGFGSLDTSRLTAFQKLVAAGGDVFYGALDSLTEGAFSSDKVVARYSGGNRDSVASMTSVVEGLRYASNSTYVASTPLYVLKKDGLEAIGSDLAATSRQPIFSLNPSSDYDYDFAIDETAASRTFFVAARSTSGSDSTVSLWKYVEGATTASTTLGSFIVVTDGQAPHLEFDSSQRQIYLSLTRGEPYLYGYASVIYRITEDGTASEVIAGAGLTATASFVGASDDSTTPTSGRLARITGMALDPTKRKLYLTEQSQGIEMGVDDPVQYGRVRQLDLPASPL